MQAALAERAPLGIVVGAAALEARIVLARRLIRRRPRRCARTAAARCRRHLRHAAVRRIDDERRAPLSVDRPYSATRRRSRNCCSRRRCRPGRPSRRRRPAAPRGRRRSARPACSRRAAACLLELRRFLVGHHERAFRRDARPASASRGRTCPANPGGHPRAAEWRVWMPPAPALSPPGRRRATASTTRCARGRDHDDAQTNAIIR